MTRAAIGLVLLASVSTSLTAQPDVRVSVSGSAESYGFDPAFAFSRVTQFAVPVGIQASFGNMVDVTLSTGYSNVALTSRDTQQLADQDLSGALDTEIRLGWHVVPRRVIAFVTGVLPTGTETVSQDQLPILGVLASDVIGFRVPIPGSGGGAGGGFGAAVPLGVSWSVGIGGSVRVPFAYQPLTGVSDEIKPGTDVRFRIGVEGPLARRTYLRVAGMFARQGDYQVADTGRTSVGNRMTGHVSLNQGLGTGALTVYAFDVFRGSAEVVGASVLPRGNLLGVGARYELPLGTRVTAIPRAEFRLSDQATPEDDALKRAGSSVRFGADVEFAINGPLRIVAQGDGLFGSLRPGDVAGELVDVSGWRAGVFLEWRP
jgi:hypothetical protein